MHGYVVLCGVLSSTAAFRPLAPVPGQRVAGLRGGAADASMAEKPQKMVTCGGPLLADPATGQPLECSGYSSGNTIHDVPVSALAGGSECAMVVISDVRTRQALLGLPNALGWKYHLGVRGTRLCAVSTTATSPSSHDPSWYCNLMLSLLSSEWRGNARPCHGGCFRPGTSRPC